MANAYTNSFIHNMGLNEKNSLPHLLDRISPEMENEASLIEHSKYYNDVEFRNVLNNTNSKISILSLNSQSINAKFDQLKIFLDNINMECPISVICIQESWTHEGIEMSQFSLPNYTMLFKNRRLSTHGGLIMYIHDDFAYKELDKEIILSSTSNLFGSQCVEIWRKTRICDTASTLIDNIYTNVLDKSHTSGILIRPLSDHQIYFCVMNENYVKPTTKQKYIVVEVLNEGNVESFRKEIADLEIHNKLDDTVDRDPNYNYEIVSTLLQNAKSKHIPKRIKKFNKRRHKKERWMTDELLAQAIKKNDMYVDWKTTPITHPDYEQVKLKFKGYKKIVSKGIDKAKKEDFDRVFVAYKSDMKKTWQVISETLSRNKKSHEMPCV